MYNTTTSSLFGALPTLSTTTGLQSLSAISLDSETVAVVWHTIVSQITFSNFWKVLLVLHIAANFKLFPFVYHLRILNAVRFVLQSQRPRDDVKPEQLFQPLITSSRSPLMEIDVYGHKSNSTYFADVDIARAHLVTTLFGKGIYAIRGSTTMNGLNGKSSKFTMALGAVSCSFRRELRPYETYDMWTRIASWDEKWIYMMTHFVKRGSKVDPQEFTLYEKQRKSSTISEPSSRRGSSQFDPSSRKGSTSSEMSVIDASAIGKRPVAATAVSKIVFKDGRKTIPPSLILEMSGLLPEKDVDRSRDDYGMGWTWEKMEAERLRGLQAVRHLAQASNMEDEFTHDVALGRHYDGYGIEGVVSTLAQLGGFSKYQLL